MDKVFLLLFVHKKKTLVFLPMLLIFCPYCRMARPELEFRHAGQAHLVRPAEANDAAWADYLYMRRNPKGLHAERWRHTHGCGRYFNALRDTVTDRFVATYPAGSPRPDGGA
jgi:sarcosine oxidase subunit delta